MVRCPVCTKIQFAYLRSPKRTSCYYCGAQWIQSGAEQDGIIGLEAPQSVVRSMRRIHPTSEETT